MRLSDSAERIQLVCFDLDGTIADTEPLHRRSKEQLVRGMGYTAPIHYPDFVGKPNRTFWEPILNQLNRTDETPKSMEQKQLELILRTAREENLQPSEGLTELLAEIAVRGIPAAVCTSSNRDYADRMLTLLGISGAFDLVVGGDEVPNLKPAPDIYNKALRHFGVEGRRALAVEDSAAGIAAANAAGIPCVGYQNPTSGEQDLSGAVYLVKCLRAISYEPPAKNPSSMLEAPPRRR